MKHKPYIINLLPFYVKTPCICFLLVIQWSHIQRTAGKNSMNQELETLINNLINAGGVYAWSQEAYNAHDKLADYCEANYTEETFAIIKSRIPDFTY